MLFKEMKKIKNNNCKIEIEKLNLIIEDNFYSVESKEKFIKELEFNEKTIEFLKELFKIYMELKTKITGTINDYELYSELLKYISEQCEYAYKLSRDFEHVLKNMEKGIYHELDIIEIENDMQNILCIINLYKIYS